MDDWSDWQVVHEAREAGSFTEAAARLGVGQATVSRRVARLEERLGVALFDRHRSGLVPTEAAHRLRPHLQAIRAAADGAERAIAGLDARVAGVVRVAAPPGVCVDWLPPIAARLRRTHPDLVLEAVSDVAVRSLVRREADVAVRMSPTQEDDLLVRRIGDLAGGLYGATSLIDALRRGRPRIPREEVPVVTWSEDLAHIPIARALASLELGPVAFRSNDYLVIRAACQRGLGATVLSVDEAERLGVEEVPVTPEAPGATVPVYAVVHPALRNVPRVRVVLDALAQHAHQRSQASSSPAGSTSSSTRTDPAP